MNILKLIGITFIICLFTGTVFAQSKIVTGTVKDASGPLPGATIVEKDVPANVAASDLNGKFKITIKATSTVIIVRSIGYIAKEVKIEALVNNIITLTSDNRNLEETVIVGFAQQKKVTLTGAVSSVSGDELRQNPSVSLQNTLTGEVTGFFSQQRTGQPGADAATFYIRGVNSLTSDNQPLVIIDDIQSTYAQFSKIDANEVERVTILKDASTTAIYGVKGANGVLLVTTRRGKIGKPKITFRSEFGLSMPTIMPDYLDSYHSALLVDEAQTNDNNNLATPATNFQPTYSASDLALFQNGQDPYGHPNVDWKDAIFKKVSTQMRENLDISGGTEKVRYFLSFGAVDQGGITKDYSANTGVDGNYFYTRYNYRSNIDMAVTSTLSLKVDLTGSSGEVNTPYVGNPNGSVNGGTNDPFYDFSSYLSLAPFSYPIKNPDGSYGYSATNVNNGYNAGNIIERLALGGYTRTYENDMSFSSAAVQNLGFITKGLSIKGVVSYTSNYIYGRSETRSNFPAFIYNAVTNTYAPRDPNIYKIDKFALGYTPGSTVRQLSLQGFVNYDRAFGDHHITAIALFTRQSLTGYVDATGTNNAVNLNSTTATGTNPDQTYNFIPNNYQGLTSRIDYNYKQKYLLTISGAYNGTDRFTAAKRFGLFPAVAVGWNLAEETFVKNNVKFLDQLKLRGSYGLVGSDRIGNSFNYAYLQTYSQNNGSAEASFGTNNNLAPGIQEGTLPNTNVTWEKEKKLDLGVDFGFLNNKISGLVDYFNNNRYDELINRGTVSAIFGQTLPPVNLGRTNNHGLEFELAYRDHAGPFHYSVRGTFSYAHNTVLFDDEATAPYAYQQLTGHSLGTAYEYIWTGRYFKDQNDINNTPHLNGTHPGDLVFADLNHDGKIDGNDEEYAGKPNLPEKNYGLQFSFSYKAFTARAAFQAATAFDISAYSETIRPFTANFQPIHELAWTPALGDNAKYPALTAGTSQSDQGTNPNSFFNISGDYLRLKTAEISYALPARWMKKIHVEGANVYINGYNLLTWSKAWSLYHIDPEANTFLKYNAYPPSKTFNLGLSVSF